MNLCSFAAHHPPTLFPFSCLSLILTNLEAQTPIKVAPALKCCALCQLAARGLKVGVAAGGNVAAAAAAASTSDSLPQPSPCQPEPAAKAPALPASKAQPTPAISMTAALKNVGTVSRPFKRNAYSLHSFKSIIKSHLSYIVLIIYSQLPSLHHLVQSVLHFFVLQASPLKESLPDPEASMVMQVRGRDIIYSSNTELN